MMLLMKLWMSLAAVPQLTLSTLPACCWDLIRFLVGVVGLDVDVGFGDVFVAVEVDDVDDDGDDEDNGVMYTEGNNEREEVEDSSDE